MLFSKDLTKLLLGIPKTGSNSAYEAMKNDTVVICDERQHPRIYESVRLAKIKGYEAEYPVQEVYAFWRDPVDRFKSSLAYFKQTNPRFFYTQFSEKFIGIDLPEDNTISPEFKAVLDTINFSEMYPYVFSEKILLFVPQAVWLRDVPVTVLPFSDYENSMRTLFDIFGVNADTPIPQLNVSDASFLLPLTKEEEERVRVFYQFDYAYQP